tara:strand:+ start:235 stop:1665 length:1431 start_codon:yes stop_codon:yes gene_type:complete
MFKKIVGALIVFLIIGSFFIGYTDNRILFTLKNNIPLELRSFLKNTIFFPFNHNSKIADLTKTNSKQNSKINDLENQIVYLKELILNSNKENNFIQNIELPIFNEKIILSKNKNTYNLKKFLFATGTPWQYNERKPVGYLTQNNRNVIILDGEGNIGYFKIDDFNKNNLKLTFIKNNFTDIVNKNSEIFSKGRASFRGILIHNENIYVSFYKMIKDGCYNIAILKSSLNYENLNFEDFFSYKECSYNMSNHSGGKMVKYDNDSFFFTTGDAQLFENAQQDDSYFGKLYLINFKSGDYELIAKGMRDSQGAYWHEKNQKLFMTEHGPQGGDEINILSAEEIGDENNYGWPVATYGELGPTPIKINKFTLKDKDNHKLNGFKEPLFWFRGNSVAPSAIVNVDNFKKGFENDFFMSAMGNVPAPGRRSLHHFKYDEKNNRLIQKDIIPIGERIRDLIYLDDKKTIVMILENSPSIAVLQ